MLNFPAFSSQPKPAKGFTLIEILVAISIFSVIAIVSFTALDTYVSHRDRLSDHYGRLEKLQRLFILLERDLQFVIHRPVRDESGDEEDAILVAGDELFRVTVAIPDVRSKIGVRLQRVAWRYEDGQLLRVVWPVLDRASDSEPETRLIDDGIDQVEVNFLTYEKGRGVRRKPAESQMVLPDGVELDVLLESGENYRRVFELAKGS